MQTATGGRLEDNPWLSLVSVTLGVIMVGVDGSVVAVANPYIGRDLHASLADLQWVTNAYLLVIAATLILGGKLGDHFGRRRVFLIGVVGFSLTSVAIGLVGTIDGVILLRGVQGAFGALLLPNTLALLKAAFPPEELNRAVGIWSVPLLRPPPPGRSSAGFSSSRSRGRASSSSTCPSERSRSWSVRSS